MKRQRLDLRLRHYAEQDGRMVDLEEMDIRSMGSDEILKEGI